MKFVHIDETKQKELEAALRLTKVFMTHMGNSYYQFGEDTYCIQRDILPFSYSFIGDESSGTKIKLAEADPSLSPYCAWKIKLEQKFGDFASLSKFKGLVDLHLVGSGSYLDLKRFPNIEDLQMEKYYSKYKVDADNVKSHYLNEFTFTDGSYEKMMKSCSSKYSDEESKECSDSENDYY